MPIRFSLPRLPRLATFAAVLLGMASAASPAAFAATVDTVVGQWDVVRDHGARPCRITLNSERSDKGDFFVGIPVACRRGIPILAKVGRWSLSGAELSLTDPGGRAVLTLVADGDAFSGAGVDGATYRLVFVPAMGRSATSGDASDMLERKPREGIGDPAVGMQPAPSASAIVAMNPTAAKPSKGSSTERMADLAGRYAVLRDKTHDTGCMLTLDDKTRVKGGARAALAPACRDQGIVVFDPTAWQIVNGRLVLTAKAGHTTHLDRQADGSWLKDPAEGKSLSLKKL